MEQDCVQTVFNWLEPQSARDIQSFVGFASFCRRFIAGFSTIAAFLNKMLKGTQAQSKDTFIFLLEACRSFQTLKEAFTKAPLLLHFDPQKPF